MFALLADAASDLVGVIAILFLLFLNWIKQRLEKKTQENYEESHGESTEDVDPLKKFLEQITQVEQEIKDDELQETRSIPRQTSRKAKPQPKPTQALSKPQPIQAKEAPTPVKSTTSTLAKPLKQIKGLSKPIDRFESGHALDQHHKKVKPSKLLQGNFTHDKDWHATNLQLRPSRARRRLSALRRKRQMVLYKELLDKPMALRSSFHND